MILLTLYAKHAIFKGKKGGVLQERKLPFNLAFIGGRQVKDIKGVLDRISRHLKLPSASRVFQALWIFIIFGFGGSLICGKGIPIA